jgi:hypothetical protein
LTFGKAHKYFKLCRVKNLEKLQMRLNVVDHMVFTSPIKTTKQHHNDVFDLLFKDNQLDTSMKNNV